MSRIQAIAIPAHSREPYGAAGEEPPLGELLGDPILHALLRRDRIGIEAVWQAVGAARESLGRESLGRDSLERERLPLCA